MNGDFNLSEISPKLSSIWNKANLMHLVNNFMSQMEHIRDKHVNKLSRNESKNKNIFQKYFLNPVVKQLNTLLNSLSYGSTVQVYQSENSLEDLELPFLMNEMDM